MRMLLGSSLASVKCNIAEVSAKSYAQHTLVNIVALPLVCCALSSLPQCQNGGASLEECMSQHLCHVFQ